MRGLLALALVAGCDDGSPPPPPASSFIALARDFKEFSTWTRVEGAAAPDAHPGGEAYIYVNRPPGTGQTAFEVGTILVRALASGDGTDAQIHAMVKRGGRYNADGAAGWEWFELALALDGTPIIVWRGTGAPTGAEYGFGEAAVEADCNGCHGDASENDHVLSPRLRLPP
ncbi:MAG: hypothetical protein H6706_26995 [Myxococcales bacterium]|nr:hypothetical protein [Myxococcales bacterium]